MFQRRVGRFYHKASTIGLVAALRLYLNRKARSDFKIQPKCLASPLLLRAKSSDTDVFRQIFVEEEYASLNDLPEPHLIIDAGANVGYSSAYFLAKYPQCHVFAVEPDSKNFVALQQNLAPYGDRVSLLNAGVWSHSAPLVIQQSPYRDGREWSRQVRECDDGEEAEIFAVDVGSILVASGYDRISLLKMDIEGAEAVVFAFGAYDTWLDKVDAIAIELHDDSVFGKSSDIFYKAIEGQGFSISHAGELTIARRG